MSINQSIENVLLHNLKCKIDFILGETIATEIENLPKIENARHLQETYINDIVSKMVATKDFTFVRETFFNVLQDILIDEDNDMIECFYNSADNRDHKDSVMGSMSSLNSSIDFLSTDQLQDIVKALSNSSLLCKLESLGTLCRLSTLEHIAKQKLWQEIEVGLHNSITSNIDILQDGCLAVYAKMLSSPDPQVVREGFVSLTKISINIISAFSDGERCQSAFIQRVIMTINKFQKFIPKHWLRYPHKIVDDIICNTVILLDTSNLLLWNCLLSIDLGCKWLKSFLYGSVSRTLLFNALEKNTLILELMSSKCKPLQNCDNTINCCDNVEILFRIHATCFLSYFLQYNYGRSLLGNFHKMENGWHKSLEDVITVSKQLCNYLCFKCFSPLLETVPLICSSLHSTSDLNFFFCQFLDEYLFKSNENSNIFSSTLLATVLAKSVEYNSSLISVTIINDHNVYNHTLIHFTFVLKDIHLQQTPHLHVFESVILILKLLIFSPIHIPDFPAIRTSLVALLETLTEFNHPFRTAVDEPNKQLYHKLIAELQLQFLKKPITLAIIQKTDSFKHCIRLLFQKMEQKLGQSPCFCEVGLLISTFNYNFGYDCNCEGVTKFNDFLSCLYMRFEMNSTDSEHAKKVLKVLIPSLMECQSWPYLQDGISKDNERDLMKYLLSIPDSDIDSVINNEEYTILALHVLATVIFDFRILCILQDKFRIQELLIQMLSEFVGSDSVVLISPVSFLLNYSIVRSYSVGGPDEIHLPRNNFTDAQEYIDPFVISYPVNYDNQNIAVKEEIFSDDFTTESTSIDFRDLFLKYCKWKKYDNSFVCNLVKNFNDFKFDDLLSLREVVNDELVSLNQVTRTGICIVKRYSAYCDRFSDNIESDLSELILRCTSRCIIHSNDYCDLFVATIYFVFDCDLSITWNFLSQYAQCRNSLIVWKQRCLKVSQTVESFSLSRPLILECCDLVIMNCLPSVFRAFEICGLLPSIMFDYWIGQCYWNYLDWPEICNYISLTTLFGGEYAIYYFASILNHLQNVIKEHSYHGDIITHLKGNAIVGFCLSNNIDFIIELANKYDDIVEKTIQNMAL